MALGKVHRRRRHDIRRLSIGPEDSGNDERDDRENNADDEQRHDGV